MFHLAAYMLYSRRSQQSNIGEIVSNHQHKKLWTSPSRKYIVQFAWNHYQYSQEMKINVPT
jgi:hypothetical protein